MTAGPANLVSFGIDVGCPGEWIGAKSAQREKATVTYERFVCPQYTPGLGLYDKDV